MKEKYIEAKFSRYFRFGEYRGKGYLVDIASNDNDCVATVTERHAKNLIKDRDDLIDFLIEMVQAFDAAAPKSFDDFWYNRSKK